MPKLGTCRLCLREGVQLQDSHIIPKWAYKGLRATEPGVNPNPVAVTGGRSVQTSVQIKEHMLCAACEQRFSKREKYVSNLTMRPDGTAPILEYLTDIQDIPMRGLSRGIRKAKANALDTETVVYFAISVIWRFHVSRTRGPKKVRLGPKYAEELRRYLLAAAGFPPKARLHLFVIDQDASPSPSASRIVSSPCSLRCEGYHRHGFLLYDLYFELWIGNVLPTGMEALCLHHAPDKIVVLMPPGDIATYRNVVRTISDARPSPKLARSFADHKRR